MLHRAMLDAQLSSLFPTPFRAPTPNPMSTPSLLYPSTSPNPCATPQGGLFCGRLAEQSPPTGCEPKSLIEVSSEHTPINLPSRKDSFDTDLNDLAPTSEIIDTIGVGQLTSPLFSLERKVSANPFSAFGSQTFKRGETHA